MDAGYLKEQRQERQEYLGDGPSIGFRRVLSVSMSLHEPRVSEREATERI